MNPPSNFSSRDVLWALSNRDILRLRHWSLSAAEGTSPLKSEVTLDHPKSQDFDQILTSEYLRSWSLSGVFIRKDVHWVKMNAIFESVSVFYTNYVPLGIFWSHL